MTALQRDLADFHQFASREVETAGDDVDLEDLLNQWRAAQEQAETLAAIRRGLEDSANGRMYELHEVDAMIRKSLGLPESPIQ
jgi:hypothetical protein